MKIDVINIIQREFPSIEGNRLAELLIPILVGDQWSLTLNFKKCPAGILISVFFQELFHHLCKNIPGFDLRRIQYETDYEFQLKNIENWTKIFKRVKFAVMDYERPEPREVGRFDSYEEAEAYIISKCEVPDLLCDQEYFIRKIFVSKA